MSYRSRTTQARSSGSPFTGSKLAKLFVGAGLLLSATWLTTLTPLLRAEEDANWTGSYFANASLTGAPVLVRQDAAINFDWGGGSPATGVPADQFSVRWTRTIDFAEATYRFTTVTDDGARLYIDGELVIDKWVDQAATEWTADVSLTGGEHTVVMEYYDQLFDASARLTYFNLSTPGGDGWRGEYFGNVNLANQPILVRDDPELDFEWGLGSPAPGFPNDNFSVRWTRTITVSAGNYRFATYTDDGVRLYVDGVPVIDHWVDQSAAYYEVDLALSDGAHTVVMEYYERSFEATAQLRLAPLTNDGVLRMNTGGGSYVDSFGHLWQQDANWTGGVASMMTQSIANTRNDPLYVTERAGGNFGYALPMANGQYIVRLHLAEIFYSSPGVRRFNVTIEGQPALAEFDIHAQAGRGALITQSFPASVADGILNLQFTKVFDNAVVQAFDVYPASTSRDLASPTIGGIPEPEQASHAAPPTVTLAFDDDRALDDGFWRVDELDPRPLFENLGATSYDGQLTIAADVFDALALGSHTLVVGANDEFGNAWTQTWRFRKVAPGSGGSVPVAFDRRVLISPSTPGASLLQNPTTLQFGPDGRLYVGQQNGYIHALTLDADRNVVAVERINAIHDTPNTNTDGSSAPGVVGRHLIGIDFDPASTAQAPILWAVHSDPRLCFNKTPETCGVNINSGVLTRLTGPNFDASGNRWDPVTGLPRSRENHAPNAVHFGPDGWLYMTIGSHTNYGAPSTQFSGLPEVYLTASVMRFNVAGAPGAFPIDARSIDTPGELRPGVLELYATGYRNPYDFLWHANGRLYVNVNAGNFTAGNTPGPAHGCPNGVSFDPGTRSDFLAIVSEGDHGGHPNPARGQCVLDDGSMYATPLPADPAYRPPILHYASGASTNGMAEYTAPTFGGQMMGDIISATYAGNQSVRRVVLSADGSSVVFEEDLGFFTQPLDVEVGGEGSIYVAEHGANDVEIMEPATEIDGAWSFDAPLPTPTQELGVTACNGKVYALGGLVGQLTNTNAVWAYDPQADTWASLASYPGPGVDHVGAACVNGKVYLIGGLVKNSTPSASVYEYNPTTNAWTTRAPMPVARGAMGVAVQDGLIYVAGGLKGGNGPNANEMLAYNPVANSWVSLAPLPTARDHLAMESVGGKLYAIGGRTVLVNSVLAVNERYNPATNTWSSAAPMPVARAGIASAALGGRIQVWGGEGPSGTPTGTYAQGHDYDPSTNTWIEISGMPTPRHGTDGAALGDRAHIPGGGPVTGSSFSDAHETFSYVAGEPPPSCIDPASDPMITDSDGDGYTDQDEIDNGTDPCSASSVPRDSDADGISDLNDPDDDNDGLADADDQFQLDPNNGAATTLPWTQGWNPGTAPAGAFANSGFPGVQLTTNGVGFIEERVRAGGAGGFLSINATAGTNNGSVNSQDNALQVGFNATTTVSISSRIADPLSGLTMEPGKEGGIYFGLDEDRNVELFLTTDIGTGSPGLVMAVELAGTRRVVGTAAIPLPGPTTVDLALIVDPDMQRVIGQFRVDSDIAIFQTIGVTSAASDPGLGQLFVVGAAGGLATSNTSPTAFGLAFDHFTLAPTTAPDPSASPTPTPTGTLTPMPTPTPTPTATPTPTGTLSPSPTPTPTPTATPSVPPGTFIEQGGQVVMEAEHFTGEVSRGGKSWQLQTTPSGYVGSGLMRLLPDGSGPLNNNYATNGAELQFRIQFATPGTYHVWLRTNNEDNKDDSVHVGIDGQAVSTADKMTYETFNAWAWFNTTMDGPVATLQVTSAGLHTVNVWMREDGFRLDRLLLTTNAAFVPTGNGPAESARAGGGGGGSPTGDVAAAIADRATYGVLVVTAAVSARTMWRRRHHHRRGGASGNR